MAVQADVAREEIYHIPKEQYRQDVRFIRNIEDSLLGKDLGWINFLVLTIFHFNTIVLHFYEPKPLLQEHLW